MNPQTIQIGLLMLALLLAAFTAIARYNLPQGLVMPLVACAFLSLQGAHAEEILRGGFTHFADIAVLFTAVAIPAHMIDRSHGFQWLAAGLGRRFGAFSLRHPGLAIPLMLLAALSLTYVLAALMHNVTSILIVTPIIIRLCAKYQVPSR